MVKKHITITDVAEKAGVSKMTVSRVINRKGEITDATRQKVVEAMHDLGYRPNRIAQGLANNATFQIGIVVPSLSNQYFGAIIEGAEQFFWENDYQILVCHTGADPAREQAVMRVFEDNRVDGVIVLSAYSTPDNMTRYLLNQRAAVTINTRVDANVATRIFTDEVKSTALAVNHLIANGRRKIGYVDFGLATYASHERYRGFELALKNAGLPFDPAKQYAAIVGDFSSKANGTIHDLLTLNPEIDALVCFNNGVAAKALQTCKILGRHVPDEIAIIGYDDHFLAELTIPSLSMLDLEIPNREVGAMAARFLLERIENGEKQHEDVILKHRLYVRDSAP